MIADFVASLRPRQWTKNLLVFAGLIFSQNVHRPALAGRAVLTFLIFCVLSGSMYLINDVLDAERDRSHRLARDRSAARDAAASATSTCSTARISGGTPRSTC